MGESTALQEAVMGKYVIYVVLYIPEEKRNLYVKSPDRFYIITKLVFLS